MEQYKTIEEVFTHNFETLRKWRPLICVPHRMPEAVKHFVALQLGDAVAIAALKKDVPEHRACNTRPVPTNPTEIVRRLNEILLSPCLSC